MNGRDKDQEPFLRTPQVLNYIFSPPQGCLFLPLPQNGILRGVYPGSPTSWLVVVMATVGSNYCKVDISMGLVHCIQRYLPIR